MLNALVTALGHFRPKWTSGAEEMDGYREHPSEFDLPGAAETPPADDVATAIGTDERRMHVRAYNHWVSLLDGRDFPSIEDLEHHDLADFSANSVLLDFTCGKENPAIPYIGAAIRDECGLDDDARSIADVPSRSLLSRLTDHYLQIIANRAPVGFEAEFVNQREESICYRGILMPFSSDGDVIDFIYGVINWKKGESGQPEQVTAADLPVLEMQPDYAEAEEESAAIEGIAEPPLELTDEVVAEESSVWPDRPSGEAAPSADAEPSPPEHLTWEDSPSAGVLAAVEPDPAPQPEHFAWEDGPLADADEVPVVELDENAGLADRLWAARETAEAVKLGEGRTRAALYKALSLAYDFSVAAAGNPEDYAELLEESGVKAQARAPMTPIVKLVFGIDYDKARLTEFAAALSYANRQQVAPGQFHDFIEKQPGGLKALVAAERQARRPEAKPDIRAEAARLKLRAAPAMSLGDLPSHEEFALVVTRRCADGSYEPVAVIDDEALVERAIRRTA